MGKELDNIIAEGLSNYIIRLYNYGYENITNTRRLVLATLLNDYMKEFKEYITDKDNVAINRFLNNCVLGNCYLKYPMSSCDVNATVPFNIGNCV